MRVRYAQRGGCPFPVDAIGVRGGTRSIASLRIQPTTSKLWGHHAKKAEKLIRLIAIPAYDPINIVKIILIISCTMDV